MNSNQTTRRGLTTVAAAAALGLALAGCGSDNSASTAPAPEVSVTSAAPADPQQSSSAAAPTSSAAQQAARADDDVPQSAAVVNTAIDTAIAQLPNSVAYDFEYDDNEFQIEVTDGQTEHEVVIGADGTSVVTTETDGFDRDDAQDLRSAQVDMKQAIQVAVGEQAGIPVSAELDKDRNLLGDAPDTLAWDIEIVAQDGTEADIVVDAASAQVLSTELDK